MITALCRSDPTSRLIDQMLLGVTLITQITQSQPRLWNGGEDDKKAERMIAGQTDRGDTSQATYGWGEIMQEFQQPALLMTEVVAVMSMTMTALWSKFTDAVSQCCQLRCRVDIMQEFHIEQNSSLS